MPGSKLAVRARRPPLNERALQARKEAVRIGTQQFIADRQGLLWVPQLRTAQIATQDNLIRLRSSQMAPRIRLCETLGGGLGIAPEVAAAALPGAQ